MIGFPNAKINLGLNILRKRADGYHDIESCFYPIPWHDALEIIPSDEFKITTHGDVIPGDTKGNLCVKAYQLLHKDFQLDPVEIILLKKIPIGAGLGGGSADGAFTLSILNKYFDLKLAHVQLENYALKLGSDCPFFIKNKPAIANGRGEILNRTDIDLSGKFLALKNPGIHISTKEAYASIVPEPPKKTIEEILAQPIATWRGQLKNDFETSIFPRYPQINELKDHLYLKGALYASMTGSGSTVYGLFEKVVEMDGWRWIKL